MTDEPNAERKSETVRQVHDLIPPEWDKAPISLAHELMHLLESVVDQGTSIDSGGGDGSADLWPIVGGREYIINIRPTGRVV